MVVTKPVCRQIYTTTIEIDAAHAPHACKVNHDLLAFGFLKQKI